MVTDFRIIAQQQVGVIQQIVKIHGRRYDAAVAVSGVDFVDERTAGAAIGSHQLGIGGICFGGDERILAHEIAFATVEAL